MAIAIGFATGCLPWVVPYRATGLSARRHAWRRRNDCLAQDCAVPVAATGHPGPALVATPAAVQQRGGTAGAAPSAFGAPWATPLGHGALCPGRQAGPGPKAHFAPAGPRASQAVAVHWSQQPSHRCADSPWPTFLRGSAPCGAHRRVAARCGGCSRRMPLHPGGTRPGFFRVLPTSLTRPAPCWISLRACGTGSAGAQGPHPQRRREAQHPGPPPLPSRPASRAGPSGL